MVEIVCHFTDKKTEVDLGYYRTIIKCPLCKEYIKFSYGQIGLSFDVGVECKDGWHEIIYPKR